MATNYIVNNHSRISIITTVESNVHLVASARGFHAGMASAKEQVIEATVFPKRLVIG